MKTTTGERITPMRAAKQIFMAYGDAALVGDWADCANGYSGIETESATKAERARTSAHLQRTSERVAKYLKVK